MLQSRQRPRAQRILRDGTPTLPQLSRHMGVLATIACLGALGACLPSEAPPHDGLNLDVVVVGDKSLEIVRPTGYFPTSRGEFGRGWKEGKFRRLVERTEGVLEYYVALEDRASAWRQGANFVPRAHRGIVHTLGHTDSYGTDLA
ncbi:MAG: hypothetical protein AAF581_19105, partial [Planctomycetota bacterium]